METQIQLMIYSELHFSLEKTLTMSTKMTTERISAKIGTFTQDFDNNRNYFAEEMNLRELNPKTFFVWRSSLYIIYGNELQIRDTKLKKITQITLFSNIPTSCI